MQLLNKPIYDVAKQAFDDAIGRESKTLESYWSPGTTYPVFYRRNSDANKTTNRLTVYYGADQPIRAGFLLKGHGLVYLAINQETPENENYKKSDLIETNVVINTVSAGQEIILPCYAETLQTPYPSSGQQISVIGGTIEIITSDCAISRALQINAEFYSAMLGGRYKVSNRLFLSSLCHFYVERVTDSQEPPAEPVYSLSLDLPDTVALGSSIPLSATALRNGQPISNATLYWSSSDPAIASIADETVTFLAAGEAVIMALWLEHGIEANKPITVSEVDSIDCTFTGSDTIVHGMSSTYSASIYINGQPSTEGFVLSWSLDLPADLVGKVSLTSNGLSTTVAVVDNENLISKIFNLVASIERNGDIANFTKGIVIRGWFG